MNADNLAYIKIISQKHNNTSFNIIDSCHNRIGKFHFDEDGYIGKNLTGG